MIRAALAPYLAATMIVAAIPARAAESDSLVDVLNGKVRLLRPSAEHGTSQAAVVDGLPLAHTGQVLPLDSAGKVTGKGSASGQTAAALENLDQVLRAADSSLARVVKLNLYVASEGDLPAVRSEIAAVFHRDMKPAVSFVITPLARPDVLVAVDAVAVLAENHAPKKVALAPTAPAAVAGGAPAAVLPLGGRIYVSGQAEKGDDLNASVRKTMESLRATLKFLGRSDADIVQIKGFVTPMSGAKDVYQEMAELFGKGQVPPVVLVEWESDLPIEIELVAWAGPATDKPRDVEYLAPPGMTAPPIYSRVARTYHPQTIYVSGLYGDKAKTGREQVEAIFTSLQDIAQATGSDLRHLLKATYYVSDEEASQQLNEIRPRHYDPKRPPAASKAMVHGVGMKQRSITLDMIAAPAK